MAYKYIGVITGSKGLKGSFIIHGAPADLQKIRKGTKIKIGFSEQFSKVFTVSDWKIKKNHIATTKEIQSLEEAQTYKEQGVFVEEKDLSFENEEMMFVEEIIGDNDSVEKSEYDGYRVIEQKTGIELGRIIDVWILPANDVWVVKTNDGELPLPVIDEVVLSIDKKEKIVYAVLIPGLLDIIHKKSDENK